MPQRFLLLVVFTVCSCCAAFAGGDTVSVFFRTNESSLTDGMRSQLDNAIYNAAIPERDAIWLIGYADEVGNSKGNLALSKVRAQTIKSYLIQSGFEAEKITFVTGKGNAGAMRTTDGRGFPRDRRVDIVKAEAPPPTPVAVAPPPTPPVPVASVAIDLGKMSAGETITLKNIYFEAGRHYFRKEAYPSLEALYQSMKAHPTVRIKIEGHVCCTPETDIDGEDVDTHKLELSVNRALEVRTYLMRRGITADRMEYEGFGRRRPVVKVEHTEEEAVSNRRVEVRIIQ